jgi:long-chain acyl-CoA synthetase
MVSWFLEQVRTRADQPALYFRSGDRYASITWGQFGDAARRLVGFLISEKVKPGEHVGIWSGNRPEWHIADAGILSARCVPVPIYLSLSAGQGAYVLDHSESRVVFVENETVLARVLETRSELPRLRRVVVMSGVEDASPDGFVLPWEAALNRGAATLERQTAEADRRSDEVDLDDVATLIYTSGTTGPPKAVQITHRNLHAGTVALNSIFESGADERVLSYLPLAHIVERGFSEFRSYRFGNPTWFLDGMDNLGPRLREVRPTLFFGVPRVWEKMAQRILRQIDSAPPHRRAIGRWGLRVARRVEEHVEAGQPVPALLRRQHGLADRLVLHNIRAAVGLDQARHLTSGAAPISLETLRFFSSIGLPISEGYGQSENTAITTMNRPERIHLGTVGQPYPGVELKLAGDGEILMRGPTVFTGYYKDDAATREAVDAEGWLHTGDIGEFDEHGCLRLTDRKKDLIITAGGKNIAPSNIEGLLTGHDLIGYAACIGDKRPFVTALLTLDPDEAQAWARSRSISGSLEEISRNPAVIAEIEGHVARVNARLSTVEQVKRWRLLTQEFQVGDELTPTLKLKRKVVADKYAAVIEELYSRRPPAVA